METIGQRLRRLRKGRKMTLKMVGILAFDFMTQEMAEKVIESNGH